MQKTYLILYIFAHKGCIWRVECNLIQWGSEYQTSSVFKWSKRGWMPNGPVFKCHWIPDSPIIWILDKWTPYNRPWWPRGLKHINLPCEYQTIWNPNFKKIGIQMFPVFKWSVFRSSLYSNSHCGLLRELIMVLTIWLLDPISLDELIWICGGELEMAATSVSLWDFRCRKR